MKVEDLRPKGAGWQVQLHEKSGKQHAMPYHHSLAEMLRAYIDAAGIADDRKGWLLRTSPGHNVMALADTPMSQADAWRIIRRRAAAAGIHAPIGNHTFRAIGITAYLGNVARWSMRNRWPRTRARVRRSSTTEQKELTQDEVERIRS
jgi:integrase